MLIDDDEHRLRFFFVIFVAMVSQGQQLAAILRRRMIMSRVQHTLPGELLVDTKVRRFSVKAPALVDSNLTLARSVHHSVGYLHLLKGRGSQVELHPNYLDFTRPAPAQKARVTYDGQYH